MSRAETLQLSELVRRRRVKLTLWFPLRFAISFTRRKANSLLMLWLEGFNVKATSAMHGLIRVKDRVKFTFDIVGRQ